MTTATATDPTLPVLTDADVRHRHDFEAFVLSHARAVHRAYLSRLYGLWQEWNATFYDGRLVTPYLLLAEPSSPQALGDYSTISGFEGHGQIRLPPSLLFGGYRLVRKGEKYAEGRFRFVEDVLLHQSVPQRKHKALGNIERGYKGHGPLFAGKCNAIGARLGLPKVRPVKRRGNDRDLPSCAHWPHCVRPADYYLGALVDDVAASGDGQQINGGDDEGERGDGEPDALAAALESLKEAALESADCPIEETEDDVLCAALLFTEAYHGGPDRLATRADGEQGEGPAGR